MHINWFFISSLSLAITTLFFLIILLKYGKEKIHRIWALFILSVFGWGFFATIIAITKNTDAVNLLWKIANCSVSLIPVFLLHLTYLLTKQNLKKALIFSYCQAIIFIFLLIFTNTISNFAAVGKYCHNSILIPGQGKYYLLWFSIWGTIVAYCHFHLLSFYLKQNQKNKIALKLFFLSTITGFSCGAANFLYFIDHPFFPFANFGISTYCIIQTYAIFRHQFLGIKIAYQKGLLYSLLIAILTGIYFLLILITEWLFRGVVGYHSIFISILSAFVISLIFNPLRNRLQTFVDRIFLGKTPHEIVKENTLLRQEIERSERLKTASTLALGLCHEIRNPLTTIKTFAEYLPEKYKEPEFVKKFSKLIPSEVERINKIIQQLLNFSKPTPPTFKNTNIHALIKDTLQFLTNDLLKKRIALSESYIDSTLILKIDETQIKQAFLNVVLNAIESMPHGGALSIKTRVAQNNLFEISVTDSGCGISKEDQKQIFTPFFSRKDSGTGLGLAITYQILKNHFGEIKVESQIGAGTTMKILLPLPKF